MGIAQNQVRLYFRRSHRDRLVFDEDVIGRLAVAFESTTTDEQRSLGFLRDCLSRLTNKSRELCELRYVADLKPASIARTNGMTANSIAKALERIRGQLRECIEHKAAMEGVWS